MTCWQRTLIRVHPKLYLNPRHVAGVYCDEHGIATVLLACGREIPQPGVDLDVLVHQLTAD